MIKMIVAGVVIHQKSHSPIVILKEERGKKILPIWIGFMEASAIASRLEGIELPRPMTHDLFSNFIREAGIELKKVVVTDLVDNTYYANIYVDIQGRELLLDSRPSDAIALALRTNAPIFVEDIVMEKTGEITEIFEKESDLESELEKLLDDVDIPGPDKYKM